MLIGCPKEIKNQEYRAGMTPAATREAVAHGHRVLIETGAGIGAGPIRSQPPRIGKSSPIGRGALGPDRRGPRC